MGRGHLRRARAEAAAGVPGVTMRETLVLYRDAARAEPPHPGWAGAVGRPARPPDELPPGYRGGLRFAVPLVEMPTYLPHLHERVMRAGARHVVRRVTGLDDVLDLAPDVVVNAAGIAAGSLVGDTSFPVRGQIVRVPNPGLDLSVRDEDHPGGRAYVHPRTTDCILGGTLEVGSWDTTPDPAQTAAILDRCADIAPAVAGAGSWRPSWGCDRAGRRSASSATTTCSRFPWCTTTVTAAPGSRSAGAARGTSPSWWGSSTV